MACKVASEGVGRTSEGKTGTMGKLNLIVKVKDATESEVRKALKTAGIEVRSVVTVFKEEDDKAEKTDEGSDSKIPQSRPVS